MTTHVLKTTAAYFEAVWSGEKTFEVRYDDRGYQRGHQVRLREFDPSAPCTVCPQKPGEPWHTGPECAKYSGREVVAHIGHVMASTPQASKARAGFNGHGYVVFSLLDPERLTRSHMVEQKIALAIISADPTVTSVEAAHRMANAASRSTAGATAEDGEQS